MFILEDQIKQIMKKKKLSAIDVYKPLKINRINFYKAIKTSNLENKSLKKILSFLDLELSVKINIKKQNENKKK